MRAKNEPLPHVGSNIRAIRLRQHLSQSELAARLGMRPGPLNCIEKGRNLPSARVIHALAQVLGVTTDTILMPPEESPGTHQVREAAVPYLTTGKKVWSGPCAVPARTGPELESLPPATCHAINILSDLFLELEDLSGAVKSAELPLNLAFDRTDEGLNRLCLKVRRFLGVSDAVIFDYLELLENIGLRIIFCHLPDGMTSFSCHDIQNANAFIFIADDDLTPERQLFRLCYELGRLYLHAPGNNGNHTTPPGRDRRGKSFTPDRAARRFSALFLMPEVAVTCTVRQLGVKPDEWTLDLLFRIKHRFGVSAEAFLYRLGELRLITPRLEQAYKKAIYEFYDANQHHEPDASRRIITPNGRLWDLVLLAGRSARGAAELPRILEVLTNMGVRKV